MGGSPCVDIHMNNFTIDLAGMTILSDANLTLVCNGPIHHKEAARSGGRPLLQMDILFLDFQTRPSGLWAQIRTHWQERRGKNDFPQVPLQQRFVS